MKRSLLGLVVSLSLAIGSQAASAQGNLIPIKAGYFKGSLLTLTNDVAMAEGFYKKHGLNVELINFSSGPDELNALVSGGIDVLTWTATPIMKVNAKGLDIQAINPNVGSPAYSLIARADLDRPNRSKPYPQNIQDLKGKVIGVPARGTDMEMVGRLFLKDAKLDPDRDVTWLAVGAIPTGIAAFKAKRIDYLIAWEPGQTLLVDVEKLGVMMVDQRKGEGNALFQRFISNVSAARRSELQKEPDKYRRYAAAMVDALNFMKKPENFERVLKIFTTVSGLDEPTLRLMLKNNVQYFDAKLDCKALENVAEFGVQIGDIPADKKPTCKSFVWEQSHKYTDLGSK